MNKLTFKSENLVVDYISFNITDFTDCRNPEPIANYLSDSFGFNSVLKESFKGKSENLIFEITNQYEVSFIKSTSYFYKLLKTGIFDWSILKFEEHALSLGRIDLCFSRSNDWNHTSKSFDAFLLDCRS